MRPAEEEMKPCLLCARAPQLVSGIAARVDPLVALRYE